MNEDLNVLRAETGAQPGDKIYLAGPYMAESEGLTRRRERMFRRVAARLMNAGLVVLSPVVHSHHIARTERVPSEDHDFWMHQDLPWLECADHLFILDMDGVHYSKGTRREFEYAREQGVPVSYLNPLRWGTDVIAFMGQKRAGKDTAASALAESIRSYAGGGRVEVVGFADALKEGVDAFFGYSIPEIGERIGKEDTDFYWNRDRRATYQEIGVLMRKRFGKNFWVRSLRRRMRHALPTYLLITDLRFPNEAEWVRDALDGQIVEIDAEERLDGADGHISEHALDEWPEEPDQVIPNNGEIEVFRREIKRRFERGAFNDYYLTYS